MAAEGRLDDARKMLARARSDDNADLNALAKFEKVLASLQPAR